MQRGFAHIFALVGVLVIILIAGEVFYFGKIKPVKNIQKAPNIPVVSEVVPEQVPPTQAPKGNGFLQIPSITVAKQPEFNSYSNSRVGFKFSYDLNLSVKADSEEEFNRRGNGDFRKNFTGYVGYEPGKFLEAVAILAQNSDFDKNPLSIWIFDNPNNLTAEGWFDKYWYYPFVWGVFDRISKGHITLDKEATISGQIAKYKIVTYQPGSPKFMYIAKDGKMYLFRVIGSVGDQTLTTFRFLDSNSK